LNASPHPAVRLDPAARIARRLFATYCLAAPPLIPLVWPLSPALALTQCALAHSLWLSGTLRANCGWFGPVITRLPTSGREVWLTIDDGPYAESVPTLLSVLSGHAARATFFLEGARALALPEISRSIVTAGHTVGNHSHTHPAASFWLYSPGAARRQIDMAQAALRGVCGVEPIGFRPPVGMANPFVHEAAAMSGLPLIGWSARGYDGIQGRPVKPEQIIARILSRLQPGGIILLHQRRDGADAAILEGVLCGIADAGYTPVIPERISAAAIC